MEYAFGNGIRVLVIGDLMLDHYIYGGCSRISPEAPVPVVEIQSETFTLGGAGNVLKNLRSYDCKVDLISVTGEDDNAAIIVKELLASGIATEGIVQDKSRCTTIKSRVLAINHQLIRLDKEVTAPLASHIVELIIKKIENLLSGCDIVLISDYNKGLLTDGVLEWIFRTCRSYGITTIVDPKGTNFSKYKGANIIKPNKKEASLATNVIIKDDESLSEACRKIAEATACDKVIVTMSEDGMAFFEHGKLNKIPTKAIDVVDVTGAGDTVLASLGLVIASGYSLEAACMFANHAAAVVVSKVGSAVATLEEIKQKFPE